MKIKDYNIPGRAQGQTFRKILEGLLAASEGKQVAFITVNQREVNRVFEIAVRVCFDHLVFKCTKQRNVIEFPNGGYIIFVSKRTADTSLRGVKYLRLEDCDGVW